MDLSGNSTESETSASIKITCGDEDIAGFILDAISPDNLQAPQGVDIEAEALGDTLMIEVSCSRGIRSLIATVDDLLSCIQAAEKALEEVSS